ncbi:MAG: nucleoside triphosphate pyrophosphatase [Snowella sp.]|nr:nucleoside triphosphate pyrophosphatase [Snowella sp.]
MLPTFVLASASPARRRLLQSIGLEPVVRHSDFDESQIDHDDTVTLVENLAQAKAETVAGQFEQALILGCDSLLLVEGQSYGKPNSPQTAIARWQQMRGKVGILYTGHVLIDQCQGKILRRCGMTQVTFATIDDQMIAAYVESGEPLQCAGAFALEGKGGLFIEKIEGCHSNVIGLSLPLLRQMLTDLGYRVTDFWQ